MPLNAVSLNDDIKTNLGDQVLNEVLRNLWPQDCQTCDTPLGKQPPSLCVDIDPVIPMATLHHAACRTSCWNDRGVLHMASGLSWRSRMMNWPIEMGDEGSGPDIWPTLVINPHLEGVRLRQSAAGAWTVGTMDYGRELGLATLGPDFVIDRPVRATAGYTPKSLLIGSTVTVTIGLAQQWSWSGANEPQFIAHIKKRGGIVLGYTTAVHPEHMTSYEDFIQPVVRREIAFGFLPLAA